MQKYVRRTLEIYSASLVSILVTERFRYQQVNGLSDIEIF